VNNPRREALSALKSKLEEIRSELEIEEIRSELDKRHKRNGLRYLIH
jgi:hypothetical protein